MESPYLFPMREGFWLSKPINYLRMYDNSIYGLSHLRTLERGPAIVDDSKFSKMVSRVSV